MQGELKHGLDQLQEGIQQHPSLIDPANPEDLSSESNYLSVHQSINKGIEDGAAPFPPER